MLYQLFYNVSDFCRLKKYVQVGLDKKKYFISNFTGTEKANEPKAELECK